MQLPASTYVLDVANRCTDLRDYLTSIRQVVANHALEEVKPKYLRCGSLPEASCQICNARQPLLVTVSEATIHRATIALSVSCPATLSS
jgi:hypothetical protein